MTTKKTKRKIIQVAVAMHGGAESGCDADSTWLALCNDGTLWSYHETIDLNDLSAPKGNYQWHRIKEIPQS